MTKPYLMLASIIFMMIISYSMGQCPKDSYQPCYCVSPSWAWDPSSFRITCNRSSVAAIKTAGFTTSQTNAAISIPHFLLILNANSVIPKDLLGIRTVNSMTITCSSFKSFLSIDPAAFKASSKFLTSLTINKCDLRRLNYSFLKDFNNLGSFNLLSSSNSNQGFYTLPSLPALGSISLTSMITTDYSQYSHADYPILASGLSQFSVFFGYQFFDNTTKSFLNWLLSNSADTITSMDIDQLPLSAMPPQIGSFSQLNSLNLFDNIIPMTLPPGSLKFNVPVSAVFLDNSHIYNISTGALYGDFRDAELSLYNNNLTRFESSVFKTTLQQMKSSTGYLEVYRNPFDCASDPCHLAWLIRDNRPLLSTVYSARCSNGTYFYQLNPNAYRGCPKCP